MGVGNTHSSVLPYGICVGPPVPGSVPGNPEVGTDVAVSCGLMVVVGTGVNTGGGVSVETTKTGISVVCIISPDGVISRDSSMMIASGVSSSAVQLIVPIHIKSTKISLPRIDTIEEQDILYLLLVFPTPYSNLI